MRTPPVTRNRHHAVAWEYRSLAARYDRKWATYIAATVRETLKRLPQAHKGRLLDVACGTGALLDAVSAVRPNMTLAGVDLTPEMLDVARQRLGSRASLACGTADALPFRTAGFDIVVVANSFHFFQGPEDVLTEICRVLRPDGTLIITDWCDDYLTCRVCDRLLRLFDPAHHRIYGSDDCQALLARRGFEVAGLDRYKISWLWGLMTVTARKAA